MENKVGKKVPKHLDDDEDRKNPAYIPRKGLFFEHDLRGQTQEEEVRYVSIPRGSASLCRGEASFQAGVCHQLLAGKICASVACSWCPTTTL